MAKKITISIETGNAAFDGGNEGGFEVARILRKLANEFEQYGAPQFSGLYDRNGNKVGGVKVTGRRK